MERLSLSSLATVGRTSNPPYGVFNKSLEGASFPTGLREIFLGNSFNQPIDRVAWPGGLERMPLPGFNQPLNGVRWPRGLKSLEFLPPAEIRIREDPLTTLEQIHSGGRGFNQPINGPGIDLPPSLKTLWLSDAFRPERVVWPEGLLKLGIGDQISYHSPAFEWPSTLRRLIMMSELFGDCPPPPRRSCEVTVLSEDLELNDTEWNSPGGGESFQRMFGDVIEKFARDFGVPSTDDYYSGDGRDGYGYGYGYGNRNGKDYGNRNGFGGGNMGPIPDMFSW